tara:strand:- start:2262 stop:2777 length:516 start_codon:yes stop_codon:yes gene_type:complete
MANGDVSHADVEGFIQEITFSSTTNPTDAEVDTYCDWINNEVDAYLEESGFELNLAVTRNITWAQFTKMLGSSAFTLDAMFALHDAESPRANRWWDLYNKRIDHLRSTGGRLLDNSDRDNSSEPQYVPTLVGFQDRRRNNLFRERAAVQHFDDADSLRISRERWKTARHTV